MADAKRIELTTVGSLKKDRKPRESRPTRRFNLKLFESNEQKCPEFSYSQLLKSCENEEKKESRNGASDPLDPFGDDYAEDEKMKNLARKFEEKYAPIPSKKPGKKAGRMEDYIDLGMGYDETDPFIDNTDAYDELVPSTLTTQYGGFYINSGKLDFKEVQSESTEESVEDMSRKRKKRRLKDVDKESFRRKKKFKDVAPDMQQPKKRGRKPVDRTDGTFLKPRKKQPTVAVLLQHHKAQLQQLHVPHQQRETSPGNSSKQPRHSTPVSSSGSQLATGSLSQQLPASIVADIAALAAARLGGVTPPKLDASINDIIESVIIGAQDRDNSNGEFDPTRFLDTTSSSSGGDHSGEHPQYPVDGGGVPRLPEGLPEDLDRKLALVKAAALRSAEGKCKFFSGEVNSLLLRIELLSRELSCSHRSRVYSHLASHLPCTKETLLKRVKKLRMDSEDCKIKGPTHKLKEAIDEVMAVLEPEYEARLKSVMLKGIRLAELSSSEDEEDVIGNEEYDEDEDYDSGLDEEDFEGNRRLVRKKFKWNDKVRRYLCDVVDLKLKCFEVSKSRTQSAYTYLRNFLAFQIKPFWPRGWIRTRRLIIESRVVHAHLTRRPKKNMVTVKKFCLPAVSLLPSPNQNSARLVPLESPVMVDISSPGTMRCSQPQSSPLPSPLASPVVMGTCTPPTSRGSPIDYRAAAALLQSSTKPAGPMVSVPSSRSSHLTSPVATTAAVTSYGHSNSPVSSFHLHSKSVQAPSGGGGDADLKLTSSSSSSRTFSIFDPVGYKTISRVGSPHAADSGGGNASRRHHQTSLLSSTMSPLVAATLSPMVVPTSPATASDVLSEIINASLANFPNSDNHGLKSGSGGDLRYRESPKFSPIFGSKTGSPTSGGNVKVKSESGSSSVGVIVDAVRTAFAVPKSVLNMQKAMANSLTASSKSGDHHSGGGVVVTSAQSSPTTSSAASSLLLLKDSDRHKLGRATAQDLRIQSRSGSHHSGGSLGGHLHHQQRRTPSPVRTDRFVSADLSMMGAKLAAASATAPFHTTYDMQGAIERSLRGGGVSGKSPPPSRVHSLPTSVGSLASKLQQQQSRASAGMGYYAPAVSSPSPSSSAASDQPLNFSTSRQPASASDRLGGGSSRPSSVPSSSSASATHHQRQRSMASTTGSLSLTTSTSVRTVSLPQSHSGAGSSASGGSRKYVGGTSLLSSSHAGVKPDQGFPLEGIAASWHELHLKKVQRTLDPTSSGSVRSPGVVVGHSEVGSSSGACGISKSSHHHHHQSANHELPKVSTSSYPEAVAHLMSQGCTDLRLHKPRVPRPPTLQGNPGSP